jgi:hypothetical protein
LVGNMTPREAQSYGNKADPKEDPNLPPKIHSSAQFSSEAQI